MPIAIACPGCSTHVQVPDQLLGTLVRCPQCSQQFTAPFVEEVRSQTTAGPPPLPTSPDNAAPPQAGTQTAAKETKHCVECGAVIRRRAVICPACGVPQPTFSGFAPSSEISTKRIVTGVMAIIFGCLGVHKFILGYTVEGIIMLLGTLVGWMCMGLGPVIMFIIGLVEGIIYLSKTDSDFHATYEVGKKGWF